MHSVVTSKQNERWPHLIFPTVYVT